MRHLLATIIALLGSFCAFGQPVEDLNSMVTKPSGAPWSFSADLWVNFESATNSNGDTITSNLLNNCTVGMSSGPSAGAWYWDTTIQSNFCTLTNAQYTLPYPLLIRGTSTNDTGTHGLAVDWTQAGRGMFYNYSTPQSNSVSWGAFVCNNIPYSSALSCDLFDLERQTGPGGVGTFSDINRGQYAVYAAHTFSGKGNTIAYAPNVQQWVSMLSDTTNSRCLVQVWSIGATMPYSGTSYLELTNCQNLPANLWKFGRVDGINGTGYPTNVYYDNILSTVGYHWPFVPWSVLNDTNAPTLTITSPTNNQNLDTQTPTVTGTASDSDSHVQLVNLRVSGGAWSLANGTNSWTASPTLVTGTNTIEVQAMDWYGNFSAITTNTVVVSPSYILQDNIDGSTAVNLNIGQFSTTWRAVKFSAANTTNIVRISIPWHTNGAPSGNITMYLYGDSLPGTNAPLAVLSNGTSSAVNVNTFPGTESTWINFDGLNATINAGTNYWVVAKDSVNDNNNYPSWPCITQAGIVVGSSNGTTWSTTTTSSRAKFRLYSQQ